jgi:hypothetical protein
MRLTAEWATYQRNSMRIPNQKIRMRLRSYSLRLGGRPVFRIHLHSERATVRQFSTLVHLEEHSALRRGSFAGTPSTHRRHATRRAYAPAPYWLSPRRGSPSRSTMATGSGRQLGTHRVLQQDGRERAARDAGRDRTEETVHAHADVERPAISKPGVDDAPCARSSFSHGIRSSGLPSTASSPALISAAPRSSPSAPSPACRGS